MNNGKPFIKWAGGKTQLLSAIESRVSSCEKFKKYTTYVEPFVGGGAVFYDIVKKYPNFKTVVINDINSNLITTYKVVRDNANGLIKSLSELEETYKKIESEESQREFFLKIREQFNSSVKSDIELASFFIFLNKTCFNGLYRENSKGKFNVPFGKYKNPTICDIQTIRSDSELLKGVEILNGDFYNTFDYCSKNSFFYLDPPYKPISKTSSFNSYTKEVFDDAEQIRLKNFCDTILDSGVGFMLSNSDVKSTSNDDNFFDDLYSDYTILRVKAKRSINSNALGRAAMNELPITNF